MTRSSAAAAGAILLAVLCAAAAVRGADDAPAPPRIRSGVEVVALTVTVQNHDGSFPGNLGVDDFVVLENGVRQTISFFDHGTVPVDLALLVDSSASMNPVLPTVKHAATTLVESLTASDRASVMTFGGVLRQSSPFTSDHKVLIDAVRDMTAGGATPLFDALYIALRSFGGAKAATDFKRRAIVVFTDGDDTASLTTFDAVLQAAREAGTAVYTVMLKSVNQTMNARNTQNDFQMRRLAEETGARALVAVEESNIDPLYKSIANELAHQYSLGYVPVSALEKNQFARIAVSVRGRNLTVRARSGYVARN